MKKRALLLLTLFCVLYLSAQNNIISINDPVFPQSSFGPAQLVEDVLVTGGCSGVSDFSFQVKGDPGNRNSKSYGYFNRRGATGFPFEEGIILSTGVASGGGNAVIPDPPGSAYPSAENGLAGDRDLEAAVGRAESFDATFIKFNFTPTGNNLSFRFIMASEEYDGSTECGFADSFAFLLREVGTTNYLNLAVLPDGTPVSVKNINNAMGCASNTEFFEGYNLGDTNYGGRTKVLLANADVVSGRDYEIKLVVADQKDESWDSAIFIEAGSFNLGVDLGEDKTIAGGNGVCDSDSIILDTKAAAANHTWFLNGIEINGAGNGQFLTVTQSGTYSVDVDFGATCFTNEQVIIEFYDPVNSAVAQDLNTCSAGSNLGEFDLTENDDDVLGTLNPAIHTVTYHLTQTDANNNENRINPANEYTGEDGETIYVRLENNTSGCYDTTAFSLGVNNIDFKLRDNYTICVDTDGTEVISSPVIETGLNTTDFAFEWFLNGVLITAETGSSLQPTAGGVYTVVVTDLDTLCKTSIDDPNATTQVNESSRPTLTASLISKTFVEKNSILATAVSTGVLVSDDSNYEFNIDGGPWVSNTPNDATFTFKNVSPGEHTISARDLNGCGQSSVKIMVIDYPTSFTPNGDGYSDRWNIIGLKNQPDAKIYIFDRYGKLLKQINSVGKGWDGTFNNIAQPSDDYWFKIEYTESENNKRKVFTSHFALKR